MSLIKQILTPRSYDGAKKIAAGELTGIALMAQATLIRSVLILPGLRFMKVPWKTAIYGALIGSATISLSLVAFYMIDGND